ncbi:MAG TPA: DEAD/DEAH box helicase family protein [Candidatus Saccharimonadales bacterium]|nr:DEAD/DEAH box helicase family protein [Candidatus Saccharimonadales bacterium]
MSEPLINLAALEPLFAPHEEPNRHRARAQGDRPSQIQNGRRPSKIAIAQTLRSQVKAWRETDYPGASDTTRELLLHWFARDHLIESRSGERAPFRYYFCQREAIETLIYLYEVRGIRSLTPLMAEFGGPSAETAALGVNPDDDRWAKYAFKLATGAGKTKVMSLAIVWSYFHALRESNSPMAKHFVVTAPNLTVFERLKTDFKPAEGGQDIFDKDPLIPVAWRGDWNMSVVLQDEASGAATGGTLYLTNIHRLYENERRKPEGETYAWVGPTVSRAKALDTGAELRRRITGHARVMVLNDEAHHLWDPGSAANEAIAYLHETIASRTEAGLVAQLDFSATPKDNRGQIFQHVVCDTPLGEAVDAGIVKTPIIGKGKRWIERTSTDASERYEEQLRVGYARWLKSKEEWEKSGKKPLLFVMTQDTNDANQVAHRLNTDPVFQELNGKTTNLHTNLKGKVRWIGGRKNGYPVFDESEKEISDDDLKALRELSRQIDSDQNPYSCIVSVLMLREGWDVRNVTTIVPLRPYTSKANILPEQTLGRGLRRMTPPGEAVEVVTVIEHPMFVSLFQQELEPEGLFVEAMDVEHVPKTTVTIFPDKEHKDLVALDLLLPEVTSGFSRTASIEGLTIEEVRKQFARYRPLPVGEVRAEEIPYEGRHLITNELVEQMKIRLPLLESGIGAVSFYRDELERICGLRGTHSVLAPLLETFLTEILFEENVTLFDARLLSRISDSDVRENVRATFVPLILKRTTTKEERKAPGGGKSVSLWKPFQVTHSAHRPAVEAARTLFNLAPCNRDLEVAMSQFLDRAPDVAAFCKNAGPQSLRVDYLSGNGQLAFYTPDFLVRLNDTSYVLAETKGRVDKDVPLKARAATAWCEAASKGKTKWVYLYIPQQTFEAFGDNRLDVLARSCEPALRDLLDEAEEPQLTLAFGEVRSDETEAFISKADFAALPMAHQKMVQQAIGLFQFLEKKAGQSFAPVFTPLLGPLDEAARAVMLKALVADIPTERQAQRAFFEPDVTHLSEKDAEMFRRRGRDLKRTLIDHNGMSPIGLLRWCLQCSRKPNPEAAAIFDAVNRRFSGVSEQIYKLVSSINTFRNDYIAHQEKELTDCELARRSLVEWAGGLQRVWELHH